MPSQDGPGGAPEMTPLDQYQDRVSHAVDEKLDTLTRELAEARRELDDVRSGARALASSLVIGNRLGVSVANKWLRDLGIPELERRIFTMVAPIAGLVTIDVVASDEREAVLLATEAINRGATSLVHSMVLGGARVVSMTRTGEPKIENVGK